MKSLLTRKIPPRAALAVIALALLATVVSGREKRDLAPEPHVPLSARVAAPADLDLARLQRPRAENAIADLFAPAAEPAETREPTAAPAAPPLPFRYLAKIVDGGETAVFLMNGHDHYNVKAGQVIGKTYKVERVTENAVTFTYLPLGTRQVLPVPALN